MQKRVLLVTVVTLILLVSIPALCLASEAKTRRVNNELEKYAEARMIAIGYATSIKELYGKNLLNQAQYYQAKKQYQLAAAKFAALKLTLELDIINKGSLNYDQAKDEKISSIKNLGESAYDEYLAFSKTAREQIYGDEAKIDKLAPAVWISIAGLGLDIFSKYHDIREAKIKLLIAWLDKYFDWPSWEKIGSTSEKISIDKTNTATREINVQY